MWGTNPCSEIILRPYQFCNLSEVVVRESDTLESLKRKVRLATILGTLQSTLTDFKYLRKVWRDNTEEERLLGVSLTGIMDHSILSKTVDSPRWLEEMKQVAVDTNLNVVAVAPAPQTRHAAATPASASASTLPDLFQSAPHK